MLHITDPTWGVLIAFFVVQASLGATVVQTLERIGATLCGVFLALIVLNLFTNHVPQLLLSSLILLTFCLYLGEKSNRPFVWLYMPITYLLIIFHAGPGVSENQMVTYATYRALQITLGSAVALIVAIAFRTPSASIQLAQNNLALLECLSSLMNDWVTSYQSKQYSAAFKADLNKLLTLAESQKKLIQFIAHETLFRSRTAENQIQLEQLIFISQELLSNAYQEHDENTCVLSAHFEADLTQLKQTIQAVFSKIITIIKEKKINSSEILTGLNDWQSVLEQLMQHTKQFRETELHAFSNNQIINWYQFLVRQESFLTLIRNFFEKPINTQPTMILDSKNTKSWFWKNTYQWEYAFKTAATGIGITYLALYFNLPNAVMLGIFSLLALQVNMNITRRNILLLSIGIGVGTLAAMLLLALNIETLSLYLLGIACIVFMMGYIFHGDPSRSKIGLYGVVFFLLCVTTSASPINDWRNLIMMCLEMMLLCIVLLILCVSIWSFSPTKIIKHFQKQIRRSTYAINQTLLDNSHIHGQLYTSLRAEFNQLRQNIQTFEAFYWDDPLLQAKSKQIVLLWYRAYHLLVEITLILPKMDATEWEADVKRFMEIPLSLTPSISQLQAVIDGIHSYNNALRQRFKEGERWKFLPAIRRAHILSLFEELALCRQTFYQMENNSV